MLFLMKRHEKNYELNYELLKPFAFYNRVISERGLNLMENVSLLRASEGQKNCPNPPVTRTGEEVQAIYNRHAETVYRVCYSLTGNLADAEDATQAAFIKLMRDQTPFADEEHEKAWLITTARNQCKDIHRQWWRKKVVALDETTEAAASDKSNAGFVTDALMRLRPEMRLVLYLHYYEGYKLAEISSMLGLNLNTVKSRIRTAKQRLKMELGDDYYE